VRREREKDFSDGGWPMVEGEDGAVSGSRCWNSWSLVGVALLLCVGSTWLGWGVGLCGWEDMSLFLKVGLICLAAPTAAAILGVTKPLIDLDSQPTHLIRRPSYPLRFRSLRSSETRLGVMTELIARVL
jgi:hypothetical protein